jgi:hypothetical protein
MDMNFQRFIAYNCFLNVFPKFFHSLAATVATLQLYGLVRKGVAKKKKKKKAGNPLSFSVG